ncbi:MAG TPA: patatin-like phospholipase family protein [Xanthobacteraceae bacterium]|jgi:predicted acylesterase/phospholipase RssA
MRHPVRTALVLQGGGALGAYELGAARALYRGDKFAPDVIAGVSIGAITAVLLARPARGRKPLEALEAFWKEVTVPGTFFPPGLRRYASFFGNRHFFLPRMDYLFWPNWTYFYETAPLRGTLAQLVDTDALADPNAAPKLLVSATDLKEGQIEYFRSSQAGLTLDHILASGSLPPAFPTTVIDQTPYWDGGLFDNTPLGAIIDEMDSAPGVERTIYVVNLFPNKAPIPRNLMEIATRMKNLQFANKTSQDLKLMSRFNEVARLMEALEKVPGGNPLEKDPAYIAVKMRGYVEVPNVISITPPDPFDQFGDADFSPEAIKKRADQGETQTLKMLRRRTGTSA